MSRKKCEECGKWFKNLKSYSNHYHAFHRDITACDDINISGNISTEKDDRLYENFDLSAFNNNDTGFMSGYENATTFDSFTSANENIDMAEDIEQNNNFIDLNDHFTSDSRLDYCVKLLIMLQEAKAPLYLYKSICNWIKECNKNDPTFFNEELYSRNVVFQRLEKHFKNNLQPQKIEITCPSTNEKINIVVHDFENSLKSLLSDQDLMQPENVLIDTQKPYERIDIKNDFFADIDTGSLWNDGWATCKKENKDVLCPLIFFH